MKIAVCDDSREDRGALRALLEACGHDFEIREYGSGAELYADMGDVRECGIVFLDINMEGMDGLEAAGKIKAECPKVHIVLVTAYVNYALDGYKVKASRFLLKDDLEQTLPECVEDILREERVVEFGFVEGSVRLRVDDMGGLRLDEEETVILLSNLLDNAIHECVKVARQGRNAVIHVKLVQEGGKLIFSVRNPVAEKVEATEGTGLLNVKAVADKYGGDFAVSCDAEKFQAVVMLCLAQAWKDAYKVSGSKEGGMEKVLSMLDGMFGIKNEA